MENPLKAIKSEIEEIKRDVRVAVEIALVREAVRTGLSRLITLDPESGVSYQVALRSIGESK